MIGFISWFFKPDSVFATQELAQGDYSVAPKLLKNSFKRAVFILPGILIAKVPPKQAVVASVLGSIGVSASLYAYFKMNPDYDTDLCK